MKKFKSALLVLALLVTTQNLTYNLVGNIFNNALPNVVYAYDSTHTTDEHTTDETFSSPVDKRELAIRSVNPGYTIDGVQNVGEYIELSNLTDAPVALAGYALRYTNSSGKSSDVYIFPEDSFLVGKSLLLRLASSPQSPDADLTYTKTLAMEAGPLELLYQEEVIDSVCWTGGDFCLSKFINKSGSRTSIVQDLVTRTYSHVPIEDYTPTFDASSPGYQPPTVSTDSDPDESPEIIESRCRGLEFSEILTYYDTDKTEQFIELYNSTEDTITPTGCTIKYKTKSLALTESIPAGGYYAYRPELALTKNPTSSNNYEIIDTTGDVVDTLILPHGQKKSTSYAQFDDPSNQSSWLATYSPTPGTENTYQQYRSCAEGKVINTLTGNCIKATTIAEVTECPEGKYRNPLTGRCKSIEEDTTSAPCKEGYERNPETNRCRKIRNNDGASYPLIPQTATEKTTFIAGLAIIVVFLVGIIYIVLQYRPEIVKFIKNSKNPKKV